MQGDTGYAVSIPGLGRSLGEGNRNPLAWRIPWTEEPSRLQSMRVHRVRHDWARMHICNCLSRMGHQGGWEQAWGKIIFSPKKTPGCRWFTWQWIVNSNNVISCKSFGGTKKNYPQNKLKILKREKTVSQRFCLYTQNSNCWSTYFPRQSKPQSARLPRFLCLADQSFHRNIIGFTLLPKKGWIPLHPLFRGHFTKEPMKGSQRELCIFKIFYLFLWLHQVLGEACGI